MQRISVSSLEKFRRYMTEASDWDTEEDLIASIKGEFDGNPKTRCGTGYHKIIEGEYTITGEYDKNNIQREMILVTCDDEKDRLNGRKPFQYIFTDEQAKSAIAFRNNHPLLIYEVAGSKTYKTSRGDIQISLRADGLEGRILYDFKTKYSTYNVMDYTDSIQWKIYCDVFGLDQFIYDIFRVTKVSGENAFVENPGEPFRTTGSFAPVEEISCFVYEGMMAEIQRTLDDFMDYIHMRRFYEYLKPARSEELTF